MARDFEHANLLQRGIRLAAGTAPGSWVFSRTLDHADRLVFRAMKGKHMLSSMLSALPVAMVTTTGARSGERRTVPLLAMPTDDGMAIIGSWYGNARHPAWRHNLRKHPDGEIDVEGERWAFHAVEVEDERRERSWQKALETTPASPPTPSAPPRAASRCSCSIGPRTSARCRRRVRGVRLRRDRLPGLPRAVGRRAGDGLRARGRAGAATARPRGARAR